MTEKMFDAVADGIAARGFSTAGTTDHERERTTDDLARRPVENHRRSL